VAAYRALARRTAERAAAGGRLSPPQLADVLEVLDDPDG
jgi:hypothetical protein